eukprot:717550-Rhodomonas_salina.1
MMLSYRPTSSLCDERYYTGAWCSVCCYKGRCGTELSCAPTCAVRCAVLTSRMLLQAICVTNLAYAAIRTTRLSSPPPRSLLVCSPISLRACYAMSAYGAAMYGPDIVYGATRCP